MRQRSPRNRLESLYPVLTVSAAVLAAVSAAFAVYHWSRRGLVADAVICAVITVLCIISIILLMYRAKALKRAESLSERPIYLVTGSGPRKKKEPKRIKGKMPEELDH